VESATDQLRMRAGRAWRFLREEGAGEAWRAMRQRGLGGSLGFLGRQLRYILGDLLGKRFDRRYGVDTRGEIASGGLDVVGPHGKMGADYMPIAPRTFFRTIAALPVPPGGFTFIDFGCGKGRPLLLAGTLGFGRVLGVEHAPELVRIANRNIAAWRGRRRTPEIRAICADATQFELPPEPLILYFNGPFDDPDLLEAVLAPIAASLRAWPRPAYLVYLEAVMVTWPDELLRRVGFRRRGARRIVRFDPGSMRYGQWFAVYELA
jgi:SAM-dependent methyltransferase